MKLEVISLHKHHPCSFLNFGFFVINIIDYRAIMPSIFIFFAELPEDENEEELGDERHDSHAGLSLEVLFI